MADSVDPPPPSEVTVTQPVTPIPATAPPPRQGCMDKRSTLEKILIVLVIIIVIICLGFIIAFLIFYFFNSPPEGTCLTEDCVKSAARLKSYMDSSVDPCNNFYDYACGGWMKSHNLGPTQHMISATSMIQDTNNLKIRGLLERPKAADEAPYKTQPKVFYAACMNTGKLDERGSEPFIKLLNSVGKFPTLDKSWKKSEFKLEDILIQLTKLATMPLFTIDVQRDIKNSAVNRIYISDATLPLYNASKYKAGRNDTRVMSYEKWLVDNLVLLGGSRSDVEQDVKNSLDLEIKIAKLMRSDNEKKDQASRYNPMTSAMFQSKYPWLNWHEYFQGVAADETVGGVFIPIDEIIINTEPAYLDKLGALLNSTNKRVLANYLMSHLIKFTRLLSSDFVALSDQFKKVTQGVDPKPRWEICIARATSVFPESVSRMYVDEFFSKSAQTYMEEMISDLKTSFSQILEEIQWMMDETKKKAESKLKSMVSKVGYPEYIKDDDRLNRLYKVIPTKENEHFESFIESEKYFAVERMRKLRESKDKTKWDVHAAVVNANYDFLDNEIVFPAAFLQAPLFSPEYSSSMNYGAIGAIIGHEITHGFDDSGHMYDHNGEFVDWWSEEDKKNFNYKADCFVNQYGCFKYDKYSIDGKMTLGENIADNGGLKQSYRAYRNLIKRRGGEEQRLPGLKLKHNQIFFLSLAQVLCYKSNDELKKEITESDSHSPPPLRLRGSLQNSKEFADAFNCPVDSRMNPKSKCVLW